MRVADLEERAVAAMQPVNFQLGCLERWRFVTLQPHAEDSRPVRRVMHHRARRELLDGWGSGRGITTSGSCEPLQKDRKRLQFGPDCLGKSSDAGRTASGPK